MKHGFRIKLLIAIALILLCVFFASYISNTHYRTLESELVNAEMRLTRSRAEDLADGIRRNLNYLRGIPGFFVHAVRVNHSLSEFGPNVAASALPYETRKQKWTRNPVLNDLDRTLAVACTNLHADIIFVVNAAGDAVAASNWNAPDSKIGTNFADWKSFKLNKAGKMAEQYAVGKTTHLPGLYFSSPVFRHGQFMGAVIAKTDVARLSFLVSQRDAFVTDRNGVVILSHDKREAMLMHALAGAPVNRLSIATRKSIYQRSDFPELQIRPWGDSDFSSLVRFPNQELPHVMATAKIPEYRLTVHADGELPELARLKHEHDIYFLLLSALGSVLSLSLFGGVLYLRTIRRAEEKLSKSEQRFRTLEAGTFEGIAITSLGRFIDVNDQFLQILGYERKEVMGRQVADLIAPDDRDRVMKHFRNESESRLEHAMLHKNGSLVQVETHGQTIDRQGIPTRLTAIRNITEEKRKQEQLEDYRQRLEGQVAEESTKFRALVEQSLVGIYVIQGDTFQYVNPGFAQIFGYDSPNEIVGKIPIMQLVSPEDEQKVASNLKQRLDGKTDAVRYSLNAVRRDGSAIIVDVHGRLIEFHGKPAIIGTLVDITEERRTQDELARLADQKAAELARKELIYGALFRQIGSGVEIIDPHSLQFLEVNDATCRMLGYSREELLRMRLTDTQADQNEEQLKEAIRKLFAAGTRRFENRHRRKDGSVYDAEISATLLKLHERDLIVAVHDDITERKQAELARRKAAKEIEDLYDNAPCGYHSIDENGIIVRINQTELDWLGYTRGELIGKELDSLFTESGRKSFPDALANLKKQGYAHDLEYEFMRKDGSLLPVLLNATALYDENGNFVMSRSTIFDLSERKRLEHELEQQAHTDPLTGLNNRRYFYELAEHELVRSRRFGMPLSLLMMDIDHFKQLNDEHGHDAGDAILKKMGTCCLQTLREVDILGRIGGEEFAVMLPGIDGGQALEAAERLRQALAEMVVSLPSGKAVSLTVSIGVSGALGANESLDEMLKRADEALYAAKHAGRNCVRQRNLY